MSDVPGSRSWQAVWLAPPWAPCDSGRLRRGEKGFEEVHFGSFRMSRSLLDRTGVAGGVWRRGEDEHTELASQDHQA